MSCWICYEAFGDGSVADGCELDEMVDATKARIAALEAERDDARARLAKAEELLERVPHFGIKSTPCPCELCAFLASVERKADQRG